jgi:hypothetical protein
LLHRPHAATKEYVHHADGKRSQGEVRDTMMNIRYMLAEPHEASATLLGRFLCRVFRYHGLTCRGAMSHWPTSAVKGRWRKSGSRFRI